MDLAAPVLLINPDWGLSLHLLWHVTSTEMFDVFDEKYNGPDGTSKCMGCQHVYPARINSRVTRYVEQET